MNLFENKISATFSVVTTLGKLIPIAAIIIFGLFWGNQNALSQTVTEVSQSTSNFGVAILATLFAYDGWILIANLGGEMKNPQKLLPKAIILGISTVLVIYTLITIGILRFLPANLIHHLGEKCSSIYMTEKLSVLLWAGKIIAAGIIISMLGTLNGKVLTFLNCLCYGQAKRHPLFQKLILLSPKTKQPIAATVFVSALAFIMMLFFDPNRLLIYVSFQFIASTF